MTQKHKVICGMQQVGVGIPDVIEAWRWYYDNFGFDIKILDDEGVAERMLPYTGNKPQPRRAILAVNLAAKRQKAQLSDIRGQCRRLWDICL